MIKVKKKLPSAVSLETIKKMLSFAEKSPDGCFVEVGVYKGGTASYLTELAIKQKRNIYLYDTFEGIPFQSEIDIHKIGDFSDVDFDLIKKSLNYAKITKGIFPQSAVHMEKIAFVHLDVDQYISYKSSIRYLKNKINKKGMMWFDDYRMDGCKKAIYEEFDKNRIIEIGNQAMIQL